MNTLKTTMSKIAQIEQPERTDLAKHEIELALAEDLRKAEDSLKTAVLNASAIERNFEEAKKTLKAEANKSRSLMEKFRVNASELGLDPTKNNIYKMIEAYLQADIIKNLK